MDFYGGETDHDRMRSILERSNPSEIIGESGRAVFKVTKFFEDSDENESENNRVYTNDIQDIKFVYYKEEMN